MVSTQCQRPPPAGEHLRHGALDLGPGPRAGRQEHISGVAQDIVGGQVLSQLRPTIPMGRLERGADGWGRLGRAAEK